MRYWKGLLLPLLFSILLEGCQKAPDFKNVDGAIVAVENVVPATEKESEMMNDEQKNDDIENAKIVTDYGEIVFDVKPDEIITPNIITMGKLNQKAYSKEKIQDVICPNVNINKATDYIEENVWIEKNQDNQEGWIKKLGISNNGFDFSDYELDHKYTSMDDGEINSSECEELEAALMEKLSQLNSNYVVDTVKAYGKADEKYYDCKLILKIDDISCFADNETTVQVNGDAKISGEGISSIWMSNNYVVDQSEKVEIIDYKKVVELAENCINRKLINPFGSIKISHIQLMYMIYDSNGKYIYNPIWMLQNIEDGVIYNYVAFNAIDGEMAYYSGI